MKKVEIRGKDVEGKGCYVVLKAVITSSMIAEEAEKNRRGGERFSTMDSGGAVVSCSSAEALHNSPTTVERMKLFIHVRASTLALSSTPLGILMHHSNPLGFEYYSTHTKHCSWLNW